MLSSKLNAVLIGALALVFSDACSGQTFSCPDKIDTSEALAGAHPSWKTFNDAQPHYFTRISLTSGAPDQKAVLVPDISTKKLIGWTLTANQEYWVVCHYLSSGILLSQSIPAKNISQCSVQLKSVGTKATQQATDLICK